MLPVPAALLAALGEAALRLPPPPCPGCDGLNIVMCTLHFAVGVLRAVVWGSPC